MKKLMLVGLVSVVIAKPIAGYIVYENTPIVYCNTPKIKTAIGVFKWMNKQKLIRWKHKQQVYKNEYITCLNNHKLCVQKRTKFKPYKFDTVLKMLKGLK